MYLRVGFYLLEGVNKQMIYCCVLVCEFGKKIFSFRLIEMCDNDVRYYRRYGTFGKVQMFGTRRTNLSRVINFIC